MLWRRHIAGGGSRCARCIRDRQRDGGATEATQKGPFREYGTGLLFVLRLKNLLRARLLFFFLSLDGFGLGGLFLLFFLLEL
jgi:hypothetical protein